MAGHAFKIALSSPSSKLPATTNLASPSNEPTRSFIAFTPTARTSYFKFPIVLTASGRAPSVPSRRASSSLCARNSPTIRSAFPHTARTFSARA